MNFEDVAVVDFETDKINSRPEFPPKPVGVAIRWPGGNREYCAWGHPEKNNCDIATARAKVKDAYGCKSVVFHHGAFDMDVAECHLGLKPPNKWDDTLFLAFLKDPYTQELGLKPLAERDLKMPADDRDALKDWILANVRPGGRKCPPTKWGEHISKAPGNLVGKYAISDVDMTHGLFEAYYPEIRKRGMLDAYRREIKCAPITMEMERSGIRVHRKRLAQFQDVMEKFDADMVRGIAKKLRINPKDLKSEDNKKGFNLNSGDQLGEALLKAGKLDSVIKTATGKISTKIANLRSTCNDKDLLNMMSVHSVAEKYLSTFIRPWREQAAKSGGRILPKFNQTRGYNEGGGGARSGRFSSSDPNMQTVSSNVEDSQNKDTLLLFQDLLKKEYQYEFLGLRDFFIPDEDTVMICIDFNQQELRMLAHFEKGVLMRAYLENPDLDIHTYCQKLVKDAIGIEFPRKHIKITVFGIVYGMGVEKLAGRLEVDKDTAKKVKDGIITAVPGIKRLIKEMRYLADHDEPLVTWGGREYFCEEPRFDAKTGQWREYGYKMLNYLIQPSAADYTKQSMINVHERVSEARIALQVHDELVVMAPHRRYGPLIQEAMCDNELDVPMTTEAKYSTTTWARAAKLAA